MPLLSSSTLHILPFRSSVEPVVHEFHVQYLHTPYTCRQPFSTVPTQRKRVISYNAERRHPTKILSLIQPYKQQTIKSQIEKAAQAGAREGCSPDRPFPSPRHRGCCATTWSRWRCSGGPGRDPWRPSSSREAVDIRRQYNKTQALTDIHAESRARCKVFADGLHFTRRTTQLAKKTSLTNFSISRLTACASENRQVVGSRDFHPTQGVGKRNGCGDVENAARC